MSEAKTYIRVYSPGGYVDEECNSISFEDVRSRIGGYMEILNTGSLILFFDEDGRIKQLPPTLLLGGTYLVGTVVVGKFKGEDIVGVPKEVLDDFHQCYVKLIT